MLNIGKAIKLVRGQKNLKQTDLAGKVGVSSNYISLIEIGKRNPGMPTIQKIADALNVPLPILLFLAADKSEMADIGTENAERLAALTLDIIKATAE